MIGLYVKVFNGCTNNVATTPESKTKFSNNKSEIGFLSDYRRMNVAMTRARKKLIMVGDSATVGTDEFYAAFLEYCERLDAYKSAWEFMQ